MPVTKPGGKDPWTVAQDVGPHLPPALRPEAVSWHQRTEPSRPGALRPRTLRMSMCCEHILLEMMLLLCVSLCPPTTPYIEAGDSGFAVLCLLMAGMRTVWTVATQCTLLRHHTPPSLPSPPAALRSHPGFPLGVSSAAITTTTASWLKPQACVSQSWRVDV